MSKETKTDGLDEEVEDAAEEEETVSSDDSPEESESDASTEQPVRKKDRSKIHLDNKQSNAKKKKKEPGKVRRWFRDFFSELKKVTWPSFSKVLRQTGTVLLVTVIFLLVLMAFDSLFGWLYDLGITAIQGTSEVVTAATSMLKGGGGLL